MTSQCRSCRRACLFAILACFSVFFSAKVIAIEFTVNLPGDAVDANPGDGLCETRSGLCSLRAAVQEANALSGSDVISLPAGSFSLTGGSANEDNAQTGDLDILDDLVIRGAGIDLTRIAGDKNLSGIFAILVNDNNVRPSVSIEQLTMTEGQENVDGGIIYTESELNLRNVSVEDAGFNNSAVYAIDTNVTIVDSIFERNAISVSALRSQLVVSNSQFRNSQFASGAPLLIQNSVAQIDESVFNANQGSDGAGAISAIDSKVVITNNTFIDNNSASSGSGAISLDTGTYTVKSNVFTGNTSALTGGAISSNATTYIENNTFENNASGIVGGAIEITSLNPVTIADSFFSANNAARDCGAISIQRNANAKPLLIENNIFRDNISGGIGGAVCFDNNVHISHSEFTGNVSRTSGGAMYSFGNASSVVNTTISGNLAVMGSAIYQKSGNDARLKLQHVTIIDNICTAGNSASVVSQTGGVTLAASIVAGTGSDTACLGLIESNGYNISNDGSCALLSTGDTADTNVLLGALTPYGAEQGSTGAVPQAHLPASGSPVLEAVPSNQCLMLDQAYKNRASVQCDIGAVQLRGTDALIGVLKFDEPQFQVTELDTVATVKVSRVDGDFGPVGVHFYDTGQGSAEPDKDYEVVNGRYLEWADGESEDKLIQVSLYNDNSKEGTETIQFALAGVTGGAAIGGMSDTATLSIIDDETSQSVFAFETPTATITEDERAVVVNVVRTEDTLGAVSVNVATANRTAIAGKDYTATSSTLNFPAGAATQSVTIPITEDQEVETDENFSIVLSDPTNGAVLGTPDRIEITISDSADGNNGATDSGNSGGTGSGDPGGSTTNGNVQDDQPGSIEGSDSHTVIDAGNARGGGGSVGALFAFILLLWRVYKLAGSRIMPLKSISATTIERVKNT